MKNLLILIAAFAVFLHFYPQPELESWYEEQKQNAISTFSDATDTQARLNPEKIYQDLTPFLKQFNEDELIYLQTITSSRENVVSFYQQYCSTDQKTPQLHYKNTELVCSKMKLYQAFF